MTTTGIEAAVIIPYVPGPPTTAKIAIDRNVFSVLALVDITTAGRRVLDQLLYLHDPDTGVACISQNEMCSALGASKPTVNRGFRELAECGLAWALPAEQAKYQLHPLLTNGATSSPVMAVPEIKAADPATFTAQRRARYNAQVANLGRSA
ncbi:helix-turn-helix domain-containing protein [Streptomyces sp. H34-S4]|uniref:helix-turn-helix domain-containing protein n=1 Tax=Streptomyces sp. H34-S4 TaxID=2996463 RepID=UPI0022713288|nr:helix-turn-helix domain-containing protein [Streptomyces sp. H34-S4]MCY0937638.1 helix-turn-helix domain-containing protein [Streptomyces sp. H34-S4]